MQLQHRIGELEGTNKILRTNIDSLEREKLGLMKKLHDLEFNNMGRDATSATGFTVAELEKQLEQLRQQLVFKEHEAEDAKRKWGAAQKLQRESSGKRVRDGTDASPTRRQPLSAPATGAPATRTTPLPLLPPPSTTTPLFASPLEYATPSSATPGYTISTLLSSCPLAIGVLMQPLAFQSLTATTPHPSLRFDTTGTATTATTAMEMKAVNELYKIQSQIILELSQGSSGQVSPASLFSTLATFVSKILLLPSSSTPTGWWRRQRQAPHSTSILSYAAAAMTVIRELMLDDASCRWVALSSSVPLTTDPLGIDRLAVSFSSQRLSFTKPPLLPPQQGIAAAAAAAAGVVQHETAPPLEPFVARILSAVPPFAIAPLHGDGVGGGNGHGRGEHNVNGIISLCIRAIQMCTTFSLSSSLPYDDDGLLSAAIGAAIAIAQSVPISTAARTPVEASSLLLPLLTSGAVAQCFELCHQGGQQAPSSSSHAAMIDTVVLFHILLEHEGVFRAFADASTGGGKEDGGGAVKSAAAAAAAAAPMITATPGMASTSKPKHKTTPRTRAAARREEVEEQEKEEEEEEKEGGAQQERHQRRRQLEEGEENVRPGGVNELGEHAHDGTAHSWSDTLMQALVRCLRLYSHHHGGGTDDDEDDETELARTALAVFALLLERKQYRCFYRLLPGEAVMKRNGRFCSSPSTSKKKGGVTVPISTDPQGQDHPTTPLSLPVCLVLLAEEAVTYRTREEAQLHPSRPTITLPTSTPQHCSVLTPLMTAPWPRGSHPSTRAAQARWQRRTRLAQESLTLLRGMVIADASWFALASLEELVSSPVEGQRMLTATSRMTRIEGPGGGGGGEGGEEGEGLLLEALPVAPWAYAIGSSSRTPSVGAEGGGVAVERRGGLPCCSAADVAYLARGINARIQYKLKC